jgi:hypothetical protein
MSSLTVLLCSLTTEGGLDGPEFPGTEGAHRSLST